MTRSKPWSCIEFYLRHRRCPCRLCPPSLRERHLELWEPVGAEGHSSTGQQHPRQTGVNICYTHLWQRFNGGKILGPPVQHALVKFLLFGVVALLPLPLFPLPIFVIVLFFFFRTRSVKLAPLETTLTSFHSGLTLERLAYLNFDHSIRALGREQECMMSKNNAILPPNKDDKKWDSQSPVWPQCPSS